MLLRGLCVVPGAVEAEPCTDIVFELPVIALLPVILWLLLVVLLTALGEGAVLIEKPLTPEFVVTAPLVLNVLLIILLLLPE